jgi:hypothetical protein
MLNAIWSIVKKLACLWGFELRLNRRRTCAGL